MACKVQIVFKRYGRGEVCAVMRCADDVHRMIKTGDWSIADLVKYLVAVQSTLSEDEIKRLKLTAAFPKEQSSADSKNVVADAKTTANAESKRMERYRADQLYEPLDVFRKLGLPVWFKLLRHSPVLWLCCSQSQLWAW